MDSMDSARQEPRLVSQRLAVRDPNGREDVTVDIQDSGSASPDAVGSHGWKVTAEAASRRSLKGMGRHCGPIQAVIANPHLVGQRARNRLSSDPSAIVNRKREVVRTVVLHHVVHSFRGGGQGGAQSEAVKRDDSSR